MFFGLVCIWVTSSLLDLPGFLKFIEEYIYWTHWKNPDSRLRLRPRMAVSPAAPAQRSSSLGQEELTWGSYCPEQHQPGALRTLPSCVLLVGEKQPLKARQQRLKPNTLIIQRLILVTTTKDNYNICLPEYGLFPEEPVQEHTPADKQVLTLFLIPSRESQLWNTEQPLMSSYLPPIKHQNVLIPHQATCTNTSTLGQLGESCSWAWAGQEGHGTVSIHTIHPDTKTSKPSERQLYPDFTTTQQSKYFVLTQPNDLKSWAYTPNSKWNNVIPVFCTFVSAPRENPLLPASAHANEWSNGLWRVQAADTPGNSLQILRRLWQRQKTFLCVHGTTKKWK